MGKAYQFFILLVMGGISSLTLAEDFSSLTSCEAQSQASLVPAVFDPNLTGLSLNDAVARLGPTDEAGEALRIGIRALLEDSHFFQSGFFLHLIRNYFAAESAANESDAKAMVFLKHYTSLAQVDRLNFTRSILDLLVNTWTIYPPTALKAGEMAPKYGLEIPQYIQLGSFFRDYRRDDPGLWKLQAAMLLILEHDSATLLKQLKSFTGWFSGSYGKFAKLPILLRKKVKLEKSTDFSFELRYSGIYPLNKLYLKSLSPAHENFPAETLDYLLHRETELFTQTDIDFLHANVLPRLNPLTQKILNFRYALRQPRIELAKEYTLQRERSLTLHESLESKTQQLSNELRESEKEEKSLQRAIGLIEDPSFPRRLKELLDLDPSNIYGDEYPFEILYRYLLEEGPNLSLEDAQTAVHQLVRYIRTSDSTTKRKAPVTSSGVYANIALVRGVTKSLYLPDSFLESLIPVVESVLIKQVRVKKNLTAAKERFLKLKDWLMPNSASLLRARFDERHAADQKKLGLLTKKLKRQQEITQKLQSSLAESQAQLEQNTDLLEQAEAAYQQKLTTLPD